MLDRFGRRIRNYFRAQSDPDWSDLSDPSRYSCFLTGCFDFLGDRITGWAKNTLEYGDKDLAVAVLHCSEVIAVARAETTSSGWRFEIFTGSLISGSDILHERVRVLVRSSSGETQALRLEGSTQLELIREFASDHLPPFLVIDFRAGGNSSSFIMNGWSGQETIHRWTEGEQSALAFAPPPRDRDYVLQLLLWPFVVPGRLTEQRLHVQVNDTELGHFGVSRQSFLVCNILMSLLPDREHVTVQFLHPDAASPRSLGVSNDSRRLGLAFKKIKIVPLLTASDRASSR